MTIGIVLFTGFGVALAITTDNLGLLGVGPALGVAIGIAIGKGMADRARREGRLAAAVPAAGRQEPTAQRQRRLLGGLVVGGLALAFAVAALLLLP